MSRYGRTRGTRALWVLGAITCGILQLYMEADAADFQSPGLAPATAESVSVAGAKLREGQTLMDRGSIREAVQSIQVAERILARKLGPHDLALAGARVRLGSALGEAGEYGEAARWMAAGLAEIDRAASPDSEALGFALNAQGRFLYLTSRLSEARTTLERALMIRESLDGKASVEARITLNNLANVYSKMGDLKSSCPIYDRLVAIESAQDHPDSSRLGMYLNNLANCTSDLGGLEKGQQLYARTLAIRERLLGPNHPLVGRTYVNMASLAEVRKDNRAALNYLQHAIAIFEAKLGRDHPVTAELYINRGEMLHREGDDVLAFRDALLGERLTREHLRRTARSLSAADAWKYEQDRVSGLDLALEIVATRNDSTVMETALDAVIHSRAVLLDEMAARNRAIARTGDAEIAKLELDYATARQRLAELSLAGLRAAIADSSYRTSLESARRASKRAEDRLAQRSSVQLSAQRDREVGLSAVREALPSQSALVSFVRYAGPDTDSAGETLPDYIAFVLRSEPGPPTAIHLGHATLIDSLVLAWANAAEAGLTPRNAEEIYRRVATALRAKTWDPLLPKLRGIEQVFVVPDGALNMVSFATLPTGPGRYVVEAGPLIHYLSAERDLVPGGSRKDLGRKLLVMGGVDFNHLRDGAKMSGNATPSRGEPAGFRGTSPDCEAFRQARWSFLEGSLGEAQDVAELWRRAGRAPEESQTKRNASVRATGLRPSTILTGGAAGEGAFKRLAPSFGAIHIATHAFFVDPDCAPVSDSSGWAEAARDDPLILSGLLLAGANRGLRAGEEDGILTAEEIAALDLSRVGWVVLSGCSTARGSVASGEGVFGLRRAFKLAGAGTLIMSLWRVEDTATRRWMRALYEARFYRGLEGAAAVRAASLEVLRERRHRGQSTLPSNWGAFIAAGL